MKEDEKLLIENEVTQSRSGVTDPDADLSDKHHAKQLVTAVESRHSLSVPGEDDHSTQKSPSGSSENILLKLNEAEVAAATVSIYVTEFYHLWNRNIVRNSPKSWGALTR